MTEEIFRKYPSKTSKILLIGYILRIIPLVNTVGAVLTAIGWFKLDKEWLQHRYFKAAMIGSILLLSGIVLDALNGQITGLSTPSIQTGGTVTLDQLIDQSVKLVDFLIYQLTNPMSLLAPILAGTGLFLELLGFKAIRDKTGGAMPLYIIILLVFMVILAYLGLPAKIATANVLREFKEYLIRVKEAGTTNTPQPQVTILMKLLAAILPLVVQSILLFVVGLITYILIAYRFHKFEEYRKEAVILEKGGREESGEEQLII